MGGASATTKPNSTNFTAQLPSQQDDSQSEHVNREQEENGEEEKGECGFCVFMKAGPCGDRFTAWEFEQCVKDSEKNKEFAAAKCIDVFKILNECMKENQDYYDFFLKAEKAELKKEEQSMNESSELKANSIAESTDKQEG